MTVGVGVIGVGMIGVDHIRRISHGLSGGRVVGVTDVDGDRAAAVAGSVPAARAYGSGVELIVADDVDAVLVASWGETHEEYVLAAIAAGKPVFCEKPLATTREGARRIVEAEVAAGRRLVQVGFMRRYDAAYGALRQVVADGAIGTPLLVHCVHRNVASPSYFSGAMAITDSAVHEIDILRWLLDEDIVAATVLTPRRNGLAPEGVTDPLLLLLETSSGVLADVEVSVNAGYGYEVRGEVVGEHGTAELGDGGEVVVRSSGRRSGPITAEWRIRFAHAYDAELQGWLDAVADGGATGPTAWDGYAAAAVSDACLESLRTGVRTPVALAPRPDLYDRGRR